MGIRSGNAYCDRNSVTHIAAVDQRNGIADLRRDAIGHSLLHSVAVTHSIHHTDGKLHAYVIRDRQQHAIRVRDSVCLRLAHGGWHTIDDSVTIGDAIKLAVALCVICMLRRRSVFRGTCRSQWLLRGRHRTDALAAGRLGCVGSRRWCALRRSLAVPVVLPQRARH